LSFGEKLSGHLLSDRLGGSVDTFRVAAVDAVLDEISNFNYETDRLWRHRDT
jgi:hypothetical protein